MLLIATLAIVSVVFVIVLFKAFKSRNLLCHFEISVGLFKGFNLKFSTTNKKDASSK